THPALVHRAALDSQVHVRWMEASGQSLGLFSAIRLDPDALDPETRAAIRGALDRVPASSGIGVRGGPHACPGASAPPSTQLRCVEGNLWEASALGWIKLGLIVEGSPRARLLHHFIDRRDPRSLTWADTELPAVALRYAARRAGMPLAQSVNRTGFDGRARSAIAWLQDAEDPWSLPATRAHLHRAATDPDPEVRQQAWVLGLIGAGAILHVIQDLSVPAHARGDLSAFFLPLSDQRGDLGDR